LHVLTGLAIVLLPVGVAYTSRYLHRTWATVCSVAILLLVPVQLWLGILLLFDGHEGPLTAFQSTAQIQHAHQEHGKRVAQNANAEVQEVSADFQEPARTIGMTDDMTFTPAKVTIRVGETIRWQNTSADIHTVTADPKKAATAGHAELPDGAAPFDSGDMKPGAIFEHTFTVPGHYRYVCRPHETAGMIGDITVVRGQ
jgi:plastocyanin